MSPQTRTLSAVFAAIPAVILGAAALCAYALAQGAPAVWRLAFRGFCHGFPERSFVLFGEPMPICARCTAIYAGMLLAVVAFMAIPGLRRLALPGAVALACVIPMLLDGATQATGLRESTNALRTITGAAAAIGPMLWVMTRLERPPQSRSAVRFPKS